jgi:hypothetical protein
VFGYSVLGVRDPTCDPYSGIGLYIHGLAISWDLTGCLSQVYLDLYGQVSDWVILEMSDVVLHLIGWMFWNILDILEGISNWFYI